MKKPGKLVSIPPAEGQTKRRKGRTYNAKGLINGKLPVYLTDDKYKVLPDVAPVLVDPKEALILGFVD